MAGEIGDAEIISANINVHFPEHLGHRLHQPESDASCVQIVHSGHEAGFAKNRRPDVESLCDVLIGPFAENAGRLDVQHAGH